MAVSWQYYFQFYSNQIFGRFFYDQPVEIFLIVISLIGLAFLLGIIQALYKSYRKTGVIETLLFLLSMISFLIAAALGGIERFCYTTWGLPQLGDLVHIIVLFPLQFSFICVNTFALRLTFPEKFRLVISFLLVLATIFIGSATWAVIMGPPYATVINFVVVYSTEIAIIIMVTLIPIAAMPITIFFYSAIKFRNEDKPKSARSFWFGMGFVFFSIGASLTTPGLEFFAVFEIIAALTLYICFTMPDWFKQRIGWSD